MNLVDKVFFYYAPTILGDIGSVPFAADTESHPSRTPVRLKHIQLHRFGEDFAVEGYLHDPFEE
jgi:diaminohydroxyphosphoribosylaminopyrimidine deaminase/5-amino-6-(5-phosphoribosylamino)uracil reductase